MRIVATLLVSLCLAGCNHGLQNKEAVRQGIVDRLQARQFNMTQMAVEVTSVQFKGSHADAVVSVYPKGQSAAQGMSMKYELDLQGGKWVVTGRDDVGGAPHAGAAAPGSAMPGAANPHGGGAMPMPGGAAMPPPGGAMMPAPSDLPPAGQKK